MFGTTTKSLKPIRLENLLTFEKTISERTFHGQTFAFTGEGPSQRSDLPGATLRAASKEPLM